MTLAIAVEFPHPRSLDETFKSMEVTLGLTDIPSSMALHEWREKEDWIVRMTQWAWEWANASANNLRHNLAAKSAISKIDAINGDTRAEELLQLGSHTSWEDALFTLSTVMR